MKSHTHKDKECGGVLTSCVCVLTSLPGDCETEYRGGLCIVIITIVSLSFFLSLIGTDTSQYGTLLLTGPHNTQTGKLHLEVNGAAVLLLILATHIECIYWVMSCFTACLMQA